MRDLRDRAVRALTQGEHLFVDAERHRLIVNTLYTHLLDAPVPEADVKVAFYDCYRHLAEGGRLEEMPLVVLPREPVVRAIRRILRGDYTPIAYEGEERDHDHDREEDQDRRDDRGAQEGRNAEVERCLPRDL